MDEFNNLKIENQICFPLYVCSKEIIKMYKSFLDEIDLTYTQYITMMVLWERKHINVKELGESLYLDSGTLTPLLKKLENKGLIERKRDIKDERNLNICMTENGEKLKLRAKDIPAKIAKCVQLDSSDGVQLYKLLYKIIDKFSKGE